MTVIAYRDGVMASDSGTWCGSSVHAYTRKLTRGADGTLYGGAGNAPEVTAFLAWVDAGCQGDHPMPRRVDDRTAETSFSILRVRPGADPELITAYGLQVFAGAPYAAIGGGQATAYGALHAGATAAGAVAAAVEHDDAARGPVRSIRHEG